MPKTTTRRKPRPAAPAAAPAADLARLNAIEFVVRRLVLAQVRGAPDPEAALAAWSASIDREVAGLDRVLTEVEITAATMTEIITGQAELARLRDEVTEDFHNDR